MALGRSWPKLSGVVVEARREGMGHGVAFGLGREEASVGLGPRAERERGEVGAGLRRRVSFGPR